ncbi:MAG: hypothetical protein CL949_21070 [Erythrobacter sp.]|nr:hypothetical protein [Erythrobacter sp.]
MRRNPRKLYAERIDRVVEHIQKRVSDGSAPDLAELADVAAMSPFHFHRVYRIMTGEAVGETVRRVRLAHSVPALAQQRTIAEVAGDSGYATSQAFARAFKAAAGAFASQLRSEAAAIDTLLEVFAKTAPCRRRTFKLARYRSRVARSFSVTRDPQHRRL